MPSMPRFSRYAGRCLAMVFFPRGRAAPRYHLERRFQRWSGHAPISIGHCDAVGTRRALIVLLAAGQRYLHSQPRLFRCRRAQKVQSSN